MESGDRGWSQVWRLELSAESSGTLGVGVESNVWSVECRVVESMELECGVKCRVE